MFNIKVRLPFISTQLANSPVPIDSVSNLSGETSSCRLLAYLKLDLGLCNVLLASTATSDLLCFRYLRSDGLWHNGSCQKGLNHAHGMVLQHTSWLNSSRGKPSTALMLS